MHRKWQNMQLYIEKTSENECTWMQNPRMKPFVPDPLRQKSEANSAGLPPQLSTALTLGELLGKSSLYRQKNAIASD